MLVNSDLDLTVSLARARAVMMNHSGLAYTWSKLRTLFSIFALARRGKQFSTRRRRVGCLAREAERRTTNIVDALKHVFVPLAVTLNR